MQGQDGLLVRANEAAKANRLTKRICSQPSGDAPGDEFS